MHGSSDKRHNTAKRLRRGQSYRNAGYYGHSDSGCIDCRNNFWHRAVGMPLQPQPVSSKARDDAARYDRDDRQNGVHTQQYGYPAQSRRNSRACMKQ